MNLASCKSMNWPWSRKSSDREAHPVNAGEAFGYSADQINQSASVLWSSIQKIVDHYRSKACPCSFPRFCQVAAFDGIHDGGSCYCSETEAFIQFARPCYVRERIAEGGEVTRERWTCSTCESVFVYGWSDFSIRVSRSYLKPENVRASLFGAAASERLQVHLGIFGHAYPPSLRGTVDVLDIRALEGYYLELAPTSRKS